MPFNSPLSAGEITQTRKPTQAFEHYVLVTPNDIVWQAEVDETITNQVYAEIDWTNELQGSYLNVIEGQIVLITTSTTDFSSPIVRGRVRRVPDIADVFIDEQGTNIDDTMYITVIDDFDIMERLPRVNNLLVQLKDWDIIYQGLPPLIGGLQSAYVDFSGSNPVAFSFSPTAVATESGAAIDSYEWDIGDGSFTGGTVSTDQNIQCTFPGASVNEHRWVHLTVFDDEGVSTTFHFQVFTVDKNSSSAVLLDSGELTITGTIEDGWNTTITAWDGVALSEILDQTRVVIAGIDTYDVAGTPVTTAITSNILMIGRFRNETSNTAPDEEASIIPITDFTVEGFATQLARLPFLPQQVLDVAIPAVWGDIADPDPVRIIAYILGWHTTYLSISSFTIEDLSAYVIGDQNLSDTSVIENVAQIADVVKALPNYARSGETTIQRNANYISTADRNALDTIFDFEDEDYTGIPSLAFEYGEQIGQAVTAAIVYDTTNNTIDQNWVGRAPAQSTVSALETVQTVNQVLTADATEANAQTELKQRIANDLAFVNPKFNLDVALMDGFRWAIPSTFQWWTHTLTADLTARQRLFADTDRWWLRSITYTARPEDNASTLTALFVEETESTNAGIRPTLVPDVNALQLSFPPLSAGDYFLDDPLVNHPIDAPDLDYPFAGLGTEPEPPGNNNDTPINAEVLNVPFYNSNDVSTTRTSTVGKNYIVTAEGDAVIGAGGAWTQVFDLTGATLPDYVTVSQGTFVPGSGVEYECITTPTYRNTARIVIDPGTTYTGTQLTQYYTHQLIGGDIGQEQAAIFQQGPIAPIKGWNYGQVQNGSQSLTYTGGAPWTITTGIETYNSSSIYNPCRGWGYLTKFVIKGTGSNPFNPADNERGDAFYMGYNSDPPAPVLYTAGKGLRVNAATPGDIGVYNPAHVYQIVVAGTGVELSFDYVDEDATYTDNSHNIIKLTVQGDNMGITP